MAANINGKFSLIARLLSKAAPGQAGAATKGALETRPEAGPKKGELLNDLVRAGQGYTPQDKNAPDKNHAEREALQRFLKDPELDKLKDEIARADAKEHPELSKKERAEESRDNRRQEAKSQDSKDKQDTQRQENRREDRAEENRGVLREQQQQETREKQVQEQERAKDQQQDRDDEDEKQRRGLGWGAEEAEEAEQAEREGLYDRDAIGDGSRCRGMLEEGGRCLRRPEPGTNYCREHAGYEPLAAIEEVS